jgi:multidrug efflux pump subunit AcrB
MVELFIKKHMAVFALAVLIVIMGVVAYLALPRESTPEIKQPYIFINTTYIGVSARDIESLVTQPIEQELDGMEGLAEITSESRQNVSFIFVEFTSDVDVETALRRTKDRVDLASPSLPEGADEPTVREFSVSDWPFFQVVLSNPEGVEIIDAAAEQFREDLEGISGVLEVDIAGNPEKEVLIEVDPVRLRSYGFSIDDVIGAVQSENTSIPGGRLQNSERNFGLSVTGEIEDPAEFANIFVNANGVNVPLEELARVRFGNAEPETYSRLNGTPAITLSIKKRIGANILDMADAVRERIDVITPSLPAGTSIVVTYDESRYIRDMIADLENNMFSGFVLVLLVTVFFLGKRNSLFVSLAIPFSMLLSFFVLQLLGITLNMIVLFSLILALGMLVDNGIVIVENIFRHATMGKNRVQAAIDGSKEVAGPIAASTITTCLAFFPIIFMPGIMGDIMSFLPKTVIVVLASSLLVAVAINPVFCANFMNISPEARKKMNEGSGTFSRFREWYGRFLYRATSKPWVTIGSVSGVVLLGIIAFGILGKDPIFFPYLDPERARVHIEAPQGTPLDRTDEVTRRLEEVVQSSPASLENYESISGRAGGDTETHLASINLTYAPFNEREIRGATALAELRRRVRDVTGAVVKIEESEGGPPTGNDVSFEVRGDDYQVIGDISESILEVLRDYPELKGLDSDFEASRPEYRVAIDRGKAAYYGLSTREVASTIRTAINGSTIGTYREVEEEYDIVLRYTEDTRDSLHMLRNLEVVAHDGSRVPLSTVAEVSPRSSLGVVKRRNLNRAVNVWANFEENVENRQVVLTEIHQRVDGLKESLPQGYAIGAGAGFDVRQESTTFLIQAFVVALFLIFVVLIAQFNSVADPFIILFSVFLSIGGVLWGFLITGQSFVVIMSGIGCIALAGVVVNNCIVLVDYTHRLIRDGMPWGEALIEAGRTRLRPVLLTALTTILALIPMAIGVSFDVHSFTIQVGSESSEYWKAFALTMLFGLSFATIMTLVVVPSLLTIKYRFLDRRRDHIMVQ